MASSTPSAPVTSSCGAADTTAGRIHFSTTTSAQVRIPLTGPHFPPPPTSAHTILLGEKLSAGVKLIRRPKNFCGGGIIIPGGRGWAKKSKKKSENCRTVSKIPYSISLYIELNYTPSSYNEPNYSLPLHIELNYTLS